MKDGVFGILGFRSVTLGHVAARQDPVQAQDLI